MGKESHFCSGFLDGLSVALTICFTGLIVAYIYVDYTNLWILQYPIITFAINILSIFSFVLNPQSRSNSTKTLLTFLVFHLLLTISTVVHLSLLITNSEYFLSDDCNACSIYFYNRDQDICARTLSICTSGFKANLALIGYFPFFTLFLIINVSILKKEKRSKDKQNFIFAILSTLNLLHFF